MTDSLSVRPRIRSALAIFGSYLSLVIFVAAALVGPTTRTNPSGLSTVWWLLVAAIVSGAVGLILAGRRRTAWLKASRIVAIVALSLSTLILLISVGTTLAGPFAV